MFTLHQRHLQSAAKRAPHPYADVLSGRMGLCSNGADRCDARTCSPSGRSMETGELHAAWASTPQVHWHVVGSGMACHGTDREVSH